MKFWDESGYGKRCNCFKNGLRARIYRTWTSIITQIHAAYLAEEIFGEGSVEQYTELDHQNIDFQIHTENGLIKVQVKKTTNRKEISRMNDRSENSPDIKYIRYYVPTMPSTFRHISDKRSSCKSPHLIAGLEVTSVTPISRQVVSVTV